MNPKKALSDLKNGSNWPVYYLHGEEPFKIQEFLTKIYQEFFKDQPPYIEKLEHPNHTGMDILNSLQSLSLFGMQNEGRKIVLVQNASQMKEMDAVSKVLMEDDSDPWGGSLLILVSEGLDGRKKFHQWLSKKGFALEFTKPTVEELPQWISYLAKKLKVTVNAEAERLLTMICDNSLQRLASELEKAWIYLGANENEVITAEAVSAVGGTKNSYEMIELVEAILEKKKTRALILQEKLIKNPEDALGLVGFLTWAIKNPKLGRWDTSMAGHLIKELIQVDLKLKSAGLEPRVLIERFIVENC